MEPALDNIESIAQADPEAGTASPRKSRRKLVVTLIVISALVVLGFATGAGLLAARLIRAGGEASGDWQQRVAVDYPGWNMVGLNFSSYSGPDGSQTDYTITMVPPDRDFAIGIVYESTDGGEPVCLDEVFRPEGRYFEGADSLLDHIESTYVAEDKRVVSVVSDRDGSVTVNWMRASNFLVFSSRVGSFEVLEYDADTDSWDVTFNPDELPL